MAIALKQSLIMAENKPHVTRQSDFCSSGKAQTRDLHDEPRGESRNDYRRSRDDLGRYKRQSQRDDIWKPYRERETQTKFTLLLSQLPLLIQIVEDFAWPRLMRAEADSRD